MISPSAGQPDLVRRIRDEILEQGAITFARFMDLALHDPEHGYYSRGPERLGTSGDFITASDLGPAFGTSMARQLAELDGLLDHPSPFSAIELGAGRGWLARDVLDALGRSEGGLRERIRYTAVDASPGMREAIGEAAPQAAVADEPPGSGVGCLLAMELFDALPVHRVVRRDGKLVELGVGWDGDRLEEATLEPAPEVRAWAERYGAAAEEGFEAEVALSYDAQIARWGRALERGFALVLDYGDSSERLYSVDRRRGTVLAYRGHRTSEDYLDHVGEQDLTAHVNFSALTAAAEARGWHLAGSTTQDRFLIANGVLEEFERMDDAAYHDPAGVRRRQAIKQLIQPTGMGRIFQVRLYARGLDPIPAPAGFSDPFAR